MKLAILFAIAVSLAAQEQTTAVSGSVSDSVTHQPIPNVRVSIQREAKSGQPAPLERALVTDAGGTFHFDGLESGQYQMTVTQPSYPEARYGLKKRITVKAGEVPAPIPIVLKPGASISGHIFDEDGDPMDGCSIRITRPGADPRQVFAQNAAGMLGEEGAYRLFDISAGSYVVTAQCMRPAFQPRPLSAGPDPPPARAYPAVSLPELIQLAPGAESSGVDFHMKPAPVVYIRVTLSGSDRRDNTSVGYELRPLDGKAPQGFPNGWRLIHTDKPYFEIPQVFPGSYLLLVNSMGPGSMVGAAQRLEVADRPVETRLELRDAIELAGRVEFENPDDANAQVFSQIHLQAIPEFSISISSGPPGEIQSDGGLKLHSLFPGPSRLVLNGTSAFIKRAWLGNVELTEGQFDLSSGATGELRIVLSTKTASIRGTAPAGASIAMQLPRSAGTRYQLADPNGEFKIEGLAPGKYRIGIQEPGSFPDNLSQEITLEEGQTLVMDLKPEPNQ